MLNQFTLPYEEFEYYLSLLYIVIVRTIVEDFYWRNYCFKVNYESKLWYGIVNVLSAAPYAYMAYEWYGWEESLGVLIGLLILFLLTVTIRIHYFEIG